MTLYILLYAIKSLVKYYVIIEYVIMSGRLLFISTIVALASGSVTFFGPLRSQITDRL